MLPLSVVVPTRDRHERLARCLDALEAAIGEGDEVVVVDSASRAPVGSDRARVVRLELPGASRARNAGWRAATHDVVAFVDDDVRVDPGWADALRAAFADPATDFVTGHLRADRVCERPVGVSDPGSAGHGANLAVRRGVLVAVAGFDERLGPGARFPAAEDLDLFDRLAAAGFAGRHAPEASAVHEQWRDRRQLLALEWSYGVGVGARLAKLRRSDRGRARHATRDWVWRAGVRDGVVGAARVRHEFALAGALVRLAGTAAGWVRGASLR